MSVQGKIIWGAAVILTGIQFFQPSQNRTEKVADTHIERLYVVPENVRTMLARSCYDCHSNHTRYPWYSRIQPGAWFMAEHIKEGKGELNFSSFGEYSLRKQRSKFTAMSGQVNDGEMPLPSYTLIHRDAVLTRGEQQVLMEWFDAMADSLK